MAKRFTDTEIWKKSWFMKLPARLKLLWKFITDDCDPAGVWEENYESASLFVGEKVTSKDLEYFGDRIEKLPNGRYWLTTFIEFQYSNSLSEKSPAHKKVFQSLQKNRLYDRVYGRVSQTLQAKDKDIVEVKEEDKDFGKSENLSTEPTDVSTENADTLLFDAEKAILHSKIWFEQICMSQRMPEEKARDSLRKFHLWNIKNDKYPQKRSQVFAGFESWLMNEKNYSSNGTSTVKSPTKPVPQKVSRGGFGEL